MLQSKEWILYFEVALDINYAHAVCGMKICFVHIGNIYHIERMVLNLAYAKWKYWLAARQYAAIVLTGWIKPAGGPQFAHACSKLNTAW